MHSGICSCLNRVSFLHCRKFRDDPYGIWNEVNCMASRYSGPQRIRIVCTLLLSTIYNQLLVSLFCEVHRSEELPPYAFSKISHCQLSQNASLAPLFITITTTIAKLGTRVNQGHHHVVPKRLHEWQCKRSSGHRSPAQGRPQLDSWNRLRNTRRRHQRIVRNSQQWGSFAQVLDQICCKKWYGWQALMASSSIIGMAWSTMLSICCRRVFNVRQWGIQLMGSNGAAETGRVTSYFYVPCLFIHEQSQECAKSWAWRYLYLGAI